MTAAMTTAMTTATPAAAAATAPADPADRTVCPVLLAPLGCLSSDGQLRELIRERRERRGDAVPLWYLGGEAVAAHGLGRPDQEAVVAGDPAVITWLQLRFGGTVTSAVLSPAALRRQAMALPDPAPVPAIAAA
jgi:hypothetical protein